MQRPQTELPKSPPCEATLGRSRALSPKTPRFPAPVTLIDPRTNRGLPIHGKDAEFGASERSCAVSRRARQIPMRMFNCLSRPFSRRVEWLDINDSKVYACGEGGIEQFHLVRRWNLCHHNSSSHWGINHHRVFYSLRPSMRSCAPKRPISRSESLHQGEPRCSLHLSQGTRVAVTAHDFHHTSYSR